MRQAFLFIYLQRVSSLCSLKTSCVCIGVFLAQRYGTKRLARVSTTFSKTFAGKTFLSLRGEKVADVLPCRDTLLTSSIRSTIKFTNHSNYTMFNFKTQTKMKHNISVEERQKQMMLHKHFSRSGNPALYVGTYAKYAGGSLQGMWVNLATFSNYKQFIEFCRLLHWDEKDSELMFQDYENFPRKWYSECGLSKDTFDKIKEYSELSDNDRAMYDTYLQHFLSDGGTDIDTARERYCGYYDDDEDFAEQIFDEMYEANIPDFYRRYFDMKAFARDLFDFDYVNIDGYVFRRC